MMQRIRLHDLAVLTAILLLGACATPSPPPGPVAPIAAPAATPAPEEPVVARSEDFLIVAAQQGDTSATIAARYLADAGRSWWLDEFNEARAFQAGQFVVVPLRARNPAGIRSGGYQTIPILCYHRFGARANRLTVTGEAFQAQMDYLVHHGYTVISMRQLAAFLEGRLALPPRSVVITIDDGYRSTYEIAFPILRKLDFPAILYLYSDFVGAPDAMTWAQMQAMSDSGLVSIQPHSKAHPNLTLRLPGENDTRYRERIRREVDTPIAAIRDHLKVKSESFAYPYGDVNDAVAEHLVRQGVPLGLTVTPGGNPAFAYPYMLRRTMVFGNEDLDSFRAKLATFVRMSPR